MMSAFGWQDFLDWAWSRHHNPLSWYIRPLFLVPYCYFSYRKSLWGIAATIVALLSSMFWFPVPATLDQDIAAALQAERDYLASEWTLVKWLWTLAVPLSLGLLAVVFWKRSLRGGIALLVVIALAKLLWSREYLGDASARSMVWPALTGLFICAIALA